MDDDNGLIAIDPQTERLETGLLNRPGQRHPAKVLLDAMAYSRFNSP